MKKHTNIQRTLFRTLTLLVAMLPMGVWAQTTIHDLSGITSQTGNYILASDFSTTGTPSYGSSADSPFKGTIDGQLVTITGTWNKPLFDYVEDATIKNVIIDSVLISTGGKVGAICGTAGGATRIYNCGILRGKVGSTGGATDNPKTDNACGGLVGLLDGTSHVINCYSYATITGGNRVAGIVGYNNGTTTAASINTMVMNCMFYGDITGGTTVSPVYGGNNINNLQGGLNTFNYYAYDKLKTKAITVTGSGNNITHYYNCALAVEEKYLNRFEFYRLLLNSNKKLAAFYATGNVENADQMAKWVLETADRTIANPKPYPILKAQGTYPSIINPDITNAPDSATVGRNKGGKLGRTLSVTISGTKTDGGQSWPSGANVTTTSLTLIRTDKDFDRFNFNYDKVQLPYYNDIGTGNYTENRVVTGWKITSISPAASNDYTAVNYGPTNNVYPQDYPNFNFADRKSTNKDLYTISGRVFSQGAYFDVPYGVTSITIEPYWAKAAYIADQYYDVVYKNDYSGKQNVTQTGTQVANNTTFNGQAVKTSVSNALSQISSTSTGGLGGYGPTVYDNAVVLVGNLHLDGVPSGGTNPFTMMSVDVDNDHEPDYSLIYHHKGRLNVAPIRFDFLNVPGTAQAQRPNGADLACNVSIFKTKGWFEIANTALLYFSQFEYENLGNSDNNNNAGKVDGPLILLGGVFDQFVSTQSSNVTGKVFYIHVGGNVWFKEFGLGTHGDGSQSTPHVPVSVTGGDYDGFYLTGTYNQDADERDDNAECYISSGHFGEVAGASQEPINGDVRWQIYNADIDNFYGGGINAARPIKGNVFVDIFNSHVTTYCGGPKFGDMQKINNDKKKVTTYAEGCTFGKFFGAGYGGLSYSRKKYYDEQKYDFSNWQNKYYKSDGSGDRGKYFDGKTTDAIKSQYGKKGVGVATDFDYEFFIWSKGNTGGRFYVKFASFSLAQCNDVESRLKKCIINENFYGGGNLGKVEGKVESELDSCIVKGNAFGSGFSATLPTLQVRNAGFTKTPNYNKYSGMFEPGEFSGATEFHWKHVSSVNNNNTAIEVAANPGDTNFVYTTTDISKSNLGSVGDATLTLKGNTIVGTEGDATTGNVYGGGDESSVDGNTTVILEGKAKVLGNVYGGGNKGAVGGNSEVKIQDQ